MAAATQAGQTLFSDAGGAKMFRVTVSAMTSDQPETISYNYASCPAETPEYATMEIITAPDSRCGLFMECNVSSADSVNKTCPVRIYTEGGGDISGAVVFIKLKFRAPGVTALGVAL